MPKKISIKTVDGNRFDHIVNDENKATIIEHQYLEKWISFVDGSTRKLFYIPNIVSITETEVEDG